MVSASDAVLPALRASLPYDFERDLAPISIVTSSPYLLVVHPSVPARDFRQFLALARSMPGRLNNGSSGVGSLAHLFGELINVMAEVKLVHVPYKGASEAATAVASGQIEMSFPSITGALPLLQARKLREIAVTSGKRTSLMASVPTISESGLPGYDRTGWYGMLAPARVPREIIVQLNAEIAKAVHTPEMRNALHKQGLEPQTSKPEEFAAFIRNEIEQNAKLIKLAGVKAD
jgi:tripartite-type tricarboxylate transporter receptor subunit TctC